MTKRTIIIHSIVVGLIITIGFTCIANGQTAKNNVKSEKINGTVQKTDVETTITTPEATQAIKTEKMGISSSSAQKQQAKTPIEQQSAHISFTQESIMAGQPESYIDTVGQCPFYEMAGVQGCVPPNDIECNADWTVCTKKGE